jgi:hypothetical protein
MIIEDEFVDEKMFEDKDKFWEKTNIKKEWKREVKVQKMNEERTED